jgi:4,5-dihydroxyphthalate decarboxylase
MTDKNIHNLETLVGYSYEQGLMKNKMSLDQLFLNVEQGRKRGTFRV